MEHAVIQREEIVDGLRGLGLIEGMAVEVHSSLSSLGWVDGGADTVIEALMEVVGPQGALIMSAYPVSPPLPLTEEETARGITWKVRILDDPVEKTGLGVITDAFQKRAGVTLGKGLHRVCAWGCGAARGLPGLAAQRSIRAGRALGRLDRKGRFDCRADSRRADSCRGAPNFLFPNLLIPVSQSPNPNPQSLLSPRS